LVTGYSCAEFKSFFRSLSEATAYIQQLDHTLVCFHDSEPPTATQLPDEGGYIAADSLFTSKLRYHAPEWTPKQKINQSSHAFPALETHPPPRNGGFLFFADGNDHEAYPQETLFAATGQDEGKAFSFMDGQSSAKILRQIRRGALSYPARRYYSS
jgi:hypothetical protein